MATTGARGEETIQAGDREVRVLFTNMALADVERKLGRSIVAVARGFVAGDTGVGDVVELLRAGMEAARRDAGEPGPTITLNHAYQVMDQVGFGETAAAVMKAIDTVISYRGAREASDSPNRR